MAVTSLSLSPSSSILPSPSSSSSSSSSLLPCFSYSLSLLSTLSYHSLCANCVAGAHLRETLAISGGFSYEEMFEWSMEQIENGKKDGLSIWAYIDKEQGEQYLKIMNNEQISDKDKKSIVFKPIQSEELSKGSQEHIKEDNNDTKKNNDDAKEPDESEQDIGLNPSPPSDRFILGVALCYDFAVWLRRNFLHYRHLELATLDTFHKLKTGEYKYLYAWDRPEQQGFDRDTAYEDAVIIAFQLDTLRRAMERQGINILFNDRHKGLVELENNNNNIKNEEEEEKKTEVGVEEEKNKATEGDKEEEKKDGSAASTCAFDHLKEENQDLSAVENKYLYLDLLSVDSRFNHRGIAQQLVLAAEDYGRRRGYSYLLLEASSEYSQPLFLHKLGYSIIYEREYKQFEFMGKSVEMLQNIQTPKTIIICLKKL